MESQQGQDGPTELWRQRWSECLPVAYMLKDRYRDHWVRFHSLPGSKRYANDESEYAIILERYNTVLCELFSEKDVYVITPMWTTEPAVPQHRSNANYWQTLLVRDDPDPEFRTYSHLFFTRRSWRYGCIDDLLREVANDKVGGVLITDTRMERIHHPYDGGADVLLPTSEERDRLRNRHVAWLSNHPSGLLPLRLRPPSPKVAVPQPDTATTRVRQVHRRTIMEKISRLNGYSADRFEVEHPVVLATDQKVGGSSPSECAGQRWVTAR